MKTSFTNPYALLDEIVLVSLQLVLQPLHLRLDLLRPGVHPSQVRDSLRIIRQQLSECSDHLKISFHVLAELRFGDGELESVDSQIGRRAPDQDESVQSRSTCESGRTVRTSTWGERIAGTRNQGVVTFIVGDIGFKVEFRCI